MDFFLSCSVVQAPGVTECVGIKLLEVNEMNVLFGYMGLWGAFPYKDCLSNGSPIYQVPL